MIAFQCDVCKDTFSGVPHYTVVLDYNGEFSRLWYNVRIHDEDGMECSDTNDQVPLESSFLCTIELCASCVEPMVFSELLKNLKALRKRRAYGKLLRWMARVKTTRRN